MDTNAYHADHLAWTNASGAAPKWGLRTFLAALALQVIGGIAGHRMVGAWRDMQRAQWLPAAALHTRSQARLAHLLQHASVQVPFYRETYRRLGLDSQALRSVADLAQLPIVSKATYRAHRMEDFYAENVPAYLRLERTTSGSTGQPFAFCLDRRVLPIIFASHLFYDSWFGLRPFDRYVRIMAPPAAVPPMPQGTPATLRFRQVLTSRLQRLYESWTQRKIGLWDVDGERAHAVWQCIEAFRPDFVMGYTSTLATLADALLQQHLPLTRSLRGVITVAETLSPPRQRLITQYFNAPIINRYGLREFGSWSAQNCAASPDHFHVNTELVICEIVRTDSSPAAPGEIGRVVLTDLHNYARPFIRYETGDLAAASADSCACGRGFPLIGQLEGRSQECLRTPSGKEISPTVLGHYLFVYNHHLDAVRHYQLVQETARSARLLVVPAPGWDDSKRQALQADLVCLLGNEMDVAVETVNLIPLEKSGKRPIIKLASQV
jgi:phenylacetate-CoA ligase